MNATRPGNWVRVRRGQPCPVCEHEDYCTRTADGSTVRCMRIQSDKPNQDKQGRIGWIHKLGVTERLPAVNLKPERPPPFIDWHERCLRYARAVGGELKNLAKTLGVSEASLVAIYVGRATNSRGWYWTFPEFNDRHRIVGMSRRFPDGSKRNARYSSRGLYYEADWHRQAGPLLIVEGGSDTAAAITLGLAAVGRPNNLGGAWQIARLVRRFRWTRPIIVVGERDFKPQAKCPPERVAPCGRCCNNCWPGMFGARVVAQQLAAELKRPIEWAMPPDGLKDTRAWLVQHSNDGAAFLRGLRTRTVHPSRNIHYEFRT